jgi:hypothetical protein
MKEKCEYDGTFDDGQKRIIINSYYGNSTQTELDEKLKELHDVMIDVFEYFNLTELKESEIHKMDKGETLKLLEEGLPSKLPTTNSPATDHEVAMRLAKAYANFKMSTLINKSIESPTTPADEIYINRKACINKSYCLITTGPR